MVRPLLTDDRVVGSRATQPVDDHGFGRPIELGDRVDRTRLGGVRGTAPGPSSRRARWRERARLAGDVVAQRAELGVHHVSRRVAGAFAVGRLAPLAECPHHEDGDDRHAAGRDDRADQQSDALGNGAVALALEFDERVADQPAGRAR